jgi:hypothetical protein
VAARGVIHFISGLMESRIDFIAADLERRGIRTPRGRRWRGKTVKAIIRQPTGDPLFCPPPKFFCA